MAKIFLNAGETFNVGANSVANVVGNSGAERVSIVSGEIIADQNVERIDLPSASSTYKFAISGNEVKIYTATTNVLVATYYAGGTNQVVAFSNGSAPLVYNGQNAVTLGGAAIPAVAATIAPTVNPADTSSSATSGSNSSGTTGSTFTLTSSADVLNPTTTVAGKQTTSGDDKIYALTAGDFVSADIVDGGAGNDTLEATIDGVAAGTTVAGLLTSVENVKLTLNVVSDSSAASGGGAVVTDTHATFDASRATGIASLVITAVQTDSEATAAANAAAKGSVTVKGLSSTSTALSLADTAGTLSSASAQLLNLNLIYNYATLTGATDTVALTLNNTNNADITVKTATGTVATGDKEGAETIALTSTTTASSIGTIASTKQDGSTSVLTKLTVAGAANLTIGDTVSFATDSATSVAATVDASTFTGKLSGTFNVATDDDAITVTTGTAVDTVTITSSGTDNTTGSAVVVLNTNAGSDVVTVTDIATRVDDNTTPLVNESQITNITIDTGAGNDTINLKGGNASILAGDGDDKLVLTVVSSGVDNFDKYDSIDLGAGKDTVKFATTIATIGASQKAALAYVKNAEVIELTANGANAYQSVNLDAITGFTEAKISGGVSSVTAPTGVAGTAASTYALEFTSSNTTNSLVLNAVSFVGQKGGVGSAADAGNGIAAIHLAPALDSGANAVTLTLIDNVDVNGGAGGLNSNTANSGGDGAEAIDASLYETVNIILSGTNTTADTVTLTGGAGGSASGASAGTTAYGDTSNVGIKVGDNASIVITDTLASTDASGTALTTQYTNIDLNSIVGANVVVSAGTLRGSVTIDSTTGNATITTGSAADNITTGSGTDTIIVGGGDDTVNSKAGSDFVTIGDGNDVVVIESAGTGTATSGKFETVTGFTLASASWTGSASNDATTEFQSTNAAGTNINADLLDLDGTATVNADVTSTSFSASGISNVTYTVVKGIVKLAGSGIADVDTIAEWVDGVDAIASANSDTVAFEFGGDTYVFENATTDVLVKLVGVTGVAGIDDLANSGTVGGANFIIIA